MSKNSKWSSGNSESSTQINGLLDNACSFEGKLRFEGIVQINGSFQGDIESSGTLMVGPEANIVGNFHVDTVIVEGLVNGEVEAASRIFLQKGARVEANLKTHSLIIEEGALFHGTSQTVGKNITPLRQPTEQRQEKEAKTIG